MIAHNQFKLNFLYFIVFLGLVIDSPFSDPFGNYHAFTEYFGPFLYATIATQYKIPLPFSLYEWFFLLITLHNFKRLFFIPNDIFYGTLLYYGFIAITVALSVLFYHGNTSAMYWALKGHIILPLVAGAVFTTLTTNAEYYTLGKIVVFGIILKAGHGLYIYNFGQGFEKETAQYLIDHAYSYAMSIPILSLLIMLWLNWKKSSKFQFFIYALSILFVVIPAFILNDRRAEMAALSLSLLLVAGILAYRYPFKGSGIIVASFSAVIIYYFIFQKSSGILAKPIEMLDSLSNSKDASNIYRVVENYNILKTILENPFAGQGFGKALHEYVKLVDISASYENYLINPHNSIFSMWMSSGIIGITLFMTFIAILSMHACKVCLTIKDKFLLMITLISLVNILRFVLFSYGDQLILHTSANMLLGISVGIIAYTSSLLYEDKNEY